MLVMLCTPAQACAMELRLQKLEHQLAAAAAAAAELPYHRHIHHLVALREAQPAAAGQSSALVYSSSQAIPPSSLLVSFSSSYLGDQSGFSQKNYFCLGFLMNT